MEDVITTLSTGLKARLKPVSATLIRTLTRKIKDPMPPTVTLEDGRKMANEDDPAYKREMAEADDRRVEASLDALYLFGIELVEGVPEDDEWVDKLRLLGVEFDASDKQARKLAYIKHVATTTADVEQVSKLSRLTQEEAAEASKSVPNSA